MSRINFSILKRVPSRIIRMLAWFMGFLKRYFEWAVACGVVLGLLITSPLWPSSVRLVPLNPIVLVDVTSLRSGLISSIASSNITSITLADFNRAAKFDLSQGRKIVFFRRWYPHRDVVAFSQYHKKPGHELSAEELMMDMGLQQRKGWLGYKDSDTQWQGLGTFHMTQNINTLNELAGSLEYIWLSLGQRTPFAEHTNSFSSSPHFLSADPFYGLIESVRGKKERFELYRILTDATEFISCFAVINDSSQDVYDLRVTADLGRHSPSEAYDSVLQSFGISSERSGAWATTFRIGNLSHGPLNYKYIAIKTKYGPVNSEDVRLDKKSVLEDVTEHYAWLLLTPLGFAVVESLLGLRKHKGKPKDGSESI